MIADPHSVGIVKYKRLNSVSRASVLETLLTAQTRLVLRFEALRN